MSMLQLGMALSKHLEKAFWALILGAAGLVVTSLKDISASIGTLNERVAVVIERVSWQDSELKRQDARIQRLEIPKEDKRNGRY